MTLFGVEIDYVKMEYTNPGFLQLLLREPATEFETRHVFMINQIQKHQKQEAQAHPLTLHQLHHQMNHEQRATQRRLIQAVNVGVGHHVLPRKLVLRQMKDPRGPSGI